jgi:hypothetical protein
VNIYNLVNLFGGMETNMSDTEDHNGGDDMHNGVILSAEFSQQCLGLACYDPTDDSVSFKTACKILDRESVLEICVDGQFVAL